VIFVPVTIGLEIFVPERYLLIFIASSLAILPLARWMGDATEQLATYFDEGVGGLLNATFGNAAELIIALAALRGGLYDVVKTSIVGSIIGNVLQVLGAAMLAGGLRHQEQRFNAVAARSQATMLVLAAIALILPAYFQSAVGTTTQALDRLSVSISIVLLFAYLLNMTFALVTHRALFAGSYELDEAKARPSKIRAISVLAGATVGIAWISEILVGTIEPATLELGLSPCFPFAAVTL
jgi:Ca2+:H+ antiporter